jgi:hypothetical protein
MILLLYTITTLMAATRIEVKQVAKLEPALLT